MRRGGKPPEWEVLQVGRDEYALSHKGRQVLVGDRVDLYRHVFSLTPRGRIDVDFTNQDGLNAIMTLEEALEIGL